MNYEFIPSIVEFLFCLAFLMTAVAIARYIESRKYILPDQNDEMKKRLTFKAFMISAFFFIAMSVAGLPVVLNLAVLLGIFMVSVPVLKYREKKKRAEEFDKALPEGLQVITSSLRAGLTLRDSLATASRNAAPAFAAEAKLALNEFQVGIPLEKALGNIKQRVGTENCNLSIGAMMISTRLGGNLPEMLQKIYLTINERERIHGKLKALTAQGRMQAILVASAPPVMFVFMYMYDKERMSLLTDTFIGQCMLGTAVVLEIIGIVVTKKIMNLKF